MFTCDTLLFQRSDGILAGSEAIVAEIERSYGIRFDPTKVGIVPLGLEDWAALPFEELEPPPAGAVRVLFVGRLEERKGIDVLLEALKTILRAHPQIHVDIVGDDRLVGANGVTYRDTFTRDPDNDAVRDRVRFWGEVPIRFSAGFIVRAIFSLPRRASTLSDRFCSKR